MSPIDEALSHYIVSKPDGFLSINHLKKIGLKEAVKLASSSQKQHPTKSGDLKDDIKKNRGKIKYRKSGNWFKHRNRKAGFLNSLSNPSEPVKSFLSLVKSRKSSSLVDIASGGGSGVASISKLLGENIKIFALERDLKCLWIIQEKFKLIGKALNCEAVGADVRRMPFMKGSVDIVTSMMAMQEILGIGAVLKEIHRILKPGGSYIALFNKEPWVYDMIPVEEYQNFSRAVDMYSGYEDLVEKARENGLILSKEKTYSDQGREFCLVEIIKESNQS